MRKRTVARVICRKNATSKPLTTWYFPQYKNSSQCDCGPTDTIWPKLSLHTEIRVKWLISAQRVTSSKGLRVFPCEFKAPRINSMTLRYFLTVIAGKISLHSMNITGRSHRSSKAASIQNKGLNPAWCNKGLCWSVTPVRIMVRWECNMWAASAVVLPEGTQALLQASALPLAYYKPLSRGTQNDTSLLSVLALCSWLKISVLVVVQIHGPKVPQHTSRRQGVCSGSCQPIPQVAKGKPDFIICTGWPMEMCS